MIVRQLIILILICTIFITGCSIEENKISSPTTNSSSKIEPLKRIANDEGVSLAAKPVEISQGQIIYIPVYSHIYHGNGQQFLLTVTLSIRNTSLTEAILIRSVRYYNSGGKLVKEYTEGTLRLAPLATTEFFIPEQDNSGGSGANFIVEWVAEREVTEPVVEALMINTRSQQGISFVTSGRVIKELQPSNKK